MAEIINLADYKKTLSYRARPPRPSRRRHRRSENVIDLEERLTRPPKLRRPWRAKARPPRPRLPDCYPTLGEARALAEWLKECDCMISYFESRLAEIIIEKVDAWRFVTRRERKALMKTVNRVRPFYPEDPLGGWEPSHSGRN